MLFHGTFMDIEMLPPELKPDDEYVLFGYDGVFQAFRDEKAFFNRYKDLSREEAIAFARNVWRTINLPNLRENIVPTRERASVVLTKRPDHTLGEVRLRRM